MSKRNFWNIEQKPSLKLILLLVLLATVHLIFTLLALRYFMQEMPQLLLIEKQLFYRIAIFGFLIETVLMVVIGLFYGSRISGPVYRISSTLKKAVSGQGVSLIKLRKHDFMNELSDNFNSMILHYHSFRAGILEQLHKIAESKNLSAEELKVLEELIQNLKVPLDK